jgi:polar amino acid transport system substrate-binding protein
MRFPFLAVLALVVPAAALSAPAAEQAAPATATAVPECAELVVTGHPYYPPVSWGSGGKLVGAAPELVSRIASGLGITKVTLKDFGTWEKAQAAARSGEADVIFGIYRNAERMEYLDYAEPAFMVDPVSVVVRAGAAFPYAQWSDLKGKKGVTSAGESYGDKFDNFMERELSVTRVQGIDKALAALLDGTADDAIVPFYPGRDAVRKLGLAGKVVFLPKTVVNADMFVAFSKKSKCLPALKAGFGKALKKAVDAGKVNELLDAASDAIANQ